MSLINPGAAAVGAYAAAIAKQAGRDIRGQAEIDPGTVALVASAISGKCARIAFKAPAGSLLTEIIEKAHTATSASYLAVALPREAGGYRPRRGKFRVLGRCFKKANMKRSERSLRHAMTA